MSDSETITVADVSAGPGGNGTEPGTAVDLPVVELLTGRGFITGKSGSGKSNTASVVVEKLLENNFPVLVIDTDGEYYGLKEEFELLHAGADEECDIRVSPEHAERLAGLALDGNVPIILDVSGYLDEDVASELVLETARHLFAKEKKLKKPFLLLVEECHEYVPEGGGMGETGKMLVKIGKRGRKHGLGIVGISQRPANVKKDFITQCDWLVWHRLTWDNDTKVVRRIIDGEHADAVEDLDDGEAFLMTDWSESVRRVQFRRKRTFDAGATPGLDDFERPELKSVSDDLVEDLREITETRERRESELADLRQELEEKEARIRELERELEQARDLKRMADRFSQALLDRAEAPYRDVGAGKTAARGGATATDGANRDDGAPADTAPAAGPDDDPDDVPLHERPPLADVAPWPDPEETGGAERDGSDEDAHDGERTRGAGDDGGAGGKDDADREPGDVPAAVPPGARDTADAGDGGAAGGDGRGAAERAGSGGGRADETDGDAAEDAGTERDPSASFGTRDAARAALVAELTDRIEALDDVSRGMLRHYRTEGPSEPVAAHLAAGGDADRQVAYSRNRELRTAGLVTHARRGEYDYALPDAVREEHGDRLREADLAEAVREIEASFVETGGDRAADGGGEDGRDDAGRAAFRTEDAAFVDGLESGDGPPERSGSGARPADRGAAAGGSETNLAADEEAVLLEETASQSDGTIDRVEDARDAEFVE